MHISKGPRRCRSGTCMALLLIYGMAWPEIAFLSFRSSRSRSHRFRSFLPASIFAGRPSDARRHSVHAVHCALCGCGSVSGGLENGRT